MSRLEITRGLLNPEECSALVEHIASKKKQWSRIIGGRRPPQCMHVSLANDYRSTWVKVDRDWRVSVQAILAYYHVGSGVETHRDGESSVVVLLERAVSGGRLYADPNRDINYNLDWSPRSVVSPANLLDLRSGDAVFISRGTWHAVTPVRRGRRVSMILDQSFFAEMGFRERQLRGGNP